MTTSFLKDNVPRTERKRKLLSAEKERAVLLGQMYRDKLQKENKLDRHMCRQNKPETEKEPED